MKTAFSKIFIASIALLFFTNAVAAQNILSASQLEDFLDKTEQTKIEYYETFKNLSSEEIKTIEDYKKNGSLDEKRTIKSIFIVYQSPNFDRVYEFRYVFEFNGKTVARRDKQVAEFFNTLSSAQTSQAEREKLVKESNRYNGKGTYVWGHTLNQGIFVGKDMRPFFVYKIEGADKIGNRDVWLVSYRQKETSPLICFGNSRGKECKISFGLVPESLLPVAPLIEGKIWLDKETAQIWKVNYEVKMKSTYSENLIDIGLAQFDYQPSEFGIVVPKNFIFLSREVFIEKGQILSAKKRQTIFEYGKFSKTNVEVKDFQIKKN